MKSSTLNISTELQPTRFWKVVRTIVWKDWTSEMRKKSLIGAMLIFSLMIVLIFTFALDLDKSAKENVAVGILWVTFIFSATLGLNQTIAVEKQNGALNGVLLSPIEAGLAVMSRARPR